jgi:hypothetical protein
MGKISHIDVSIEIPMNRLRGVLWVAELGGHVEHEGVVPFQLVVPSKLLNAENP